MKIAAENEGLDICNPEKGAFFGIRCKRRVGLDFIPSFTRRRKNVNTRKVCSSADTSLELRKVRGKVNFTDYDENIIEIKGKRVYHKSVGKTYVKAEW